MCGNRSGRVYPLMLPATSRPGRSPPLHPLGRGLPPTPQNSCRRRRGVHVPRWIPTVAAGMVDPEMKAFDKYSQFFMVMGGGADSIAAGGIHPSHQSWRHSERGYTPPSPNLATTVEGGIPLSEGGLAPPPRWG